VYGQSHGSITAPSLGTRPTRVRVRHFEGGSAEFATASSEIISEHWGALPRAVRRHVHHCTSRTTRQIRGAPVVDLLWTVSLATRFTFHIGGAGFTARWLRLLTCCDRFGNEAGLWLHRRYAGIDGNLLLDRSSAIGRRRLTLQLAPLAPEYNRRGAYRCPAGGMRQTPLKGHLGRLKRFSEMSELCC